MEPESAEKTGSEEEIIDLRGDVCPYPLIMAVKRISEVEDRLRSGVVVLKFIVGDLPKHAKINNIGVFGIPHLIGGILFGLGMALAGGCASGTLYRMGEGYLSLWVAFLGMLAGYAVIAHNWGWLYPNVLEDTKVWLPQYLGWGWSVFLTISALVAIYIGISYWEEREWV